MQLRHSLLFKEVVQRFCDEKVFRPARSEQGLASVVKSGGAFDHEFIQTPLAKHASFSLAELLHRSVLALHLERLFDNAGLPTNRETARCELSSPKR